MKNSIIGNTDRRAELASPSGILAGGRCLRDQTRRRIFDVEPFHSVGNRAGAAGTGGTFWGRSDVVVGGLGLGYTAKAVLEHEAVKSLVIVEALDAVIDWHERGVLPLGPALTADPRSKFVLGDFFALAASKGFDPGAPARRFDAILVDIDHSPDFLLDPQNAAFYQPEGLQRLAAHLLPGGVFGLWSNEVTDHAFTQRLTAVFAVARAERVSFHNPLQNREFTQTIYLARTGAAPELHEAE